MNDKPSSPSKEREMSVEVFDEGSLHKYRTEIPNTVVRGNMGRGLSVHAKWLYVYLKSVASDKGICWQGTTTLAKGSGMSRTMVSQCKAELLNAKLIAIDKKHDALTHETDNIRIRDIWPINMQEFGAVRIANSPSEFVTHEDSDANRSPVRIANSPCSYSEQPVSIAHPRRDPRRRDLGSPLSLSLPPEGEERERQVSFDLWGNEGNKNSSHEGNKNGTAPTPSLPQSVPDAEPAQPVYVLTGDGTYKLTSRKTGLSRDPADLERFYRAVTEDATFSDFCEAEGLTCDVRERFDLFVLRVRKEGVRAVDWDACFRDYLKRGPAETKRKKTQPEPSIQQKGRIAAIARGTQSGGAA
jgi:hypothetical protein